MNDQRLLTIEQMLFLKRELNALLWTEDVPEVPQDLKGIAATGAHFETGKVNIQCVAHMVVTSGLLNRRGFEMVTRRGMAFVLETSPDGDPTKALLNQIARHFWFTLKDHGLVDLSLHGENENPLIYCNRSEGGRWLVEFGDDERKLQQFVKAKQQGCFYMTQGKKAVSERDMEQSLGECFGPAKKAGIQMTYGKILEYCEGLLAGAQESLAGMPRIEAWRKLAE